MTCRKRPSSPPCKRLPGSWKGGSCAISPVSIFSASRRGRRIKPWKAMRMAKSCSGWLKVANAVDRLSAWCEEEMETATVHAIGPYACTLERLRENPTLLHDRSTCRGACHKGHCWANDTVEAH